VAFPVKLRADVFLVCPPAGNRWKKLYSASFCLSSHERDTGAAVGFRGIADTRPSRRTIHDEKQDVVGSKTPENGS
jgi:hypothetical protein